jgi:hypothetical protein
MEKAPEDLSNLAIRDRARIAFSEVALAMKSVGLRRMFIKASMVGPLQNIVTKPGMVRVS